ncbi:hypothetical protein CC78DRAFT_582407 [Lojkania enalia]|uniref:Secreted protein n=1 Tax=Lojkania enalia TaxID=147567 RepID=A0A9P4K6N9_9PLEO|nr:hypothetical protein CC78DRAFT_582407 [Didymosphaeria enalia]
MVAVAVAVVVVVDLVAVTPEMGGPGVLRTEPGAGGETRRRRGHSSEDTEGFGGRLEAGIGGETKSESRRVAGRGLAVSAFRLLIGPCGVLFTSTAPTMSSQSRRAIETLPSSPILAMTPPPYDTSKQIALSACFPPSCQACSWTRTDNSSLAARPTRGPLPLRATLGRCLRSVTWQSFATRPPRDGPYSCPVTTRDLSEGMNA